MRKFLPIFLFFNVATIILSSCAPKKTGLSPRIIDNFSNDWQFAFDSIASSWETVNLPHTARLEPLVVNDQWQGTAFYRKTFEAPTGEGKKVFLYFEGVMHEADVWINGVHLCHHVGGYLPFTVDATPVVQPGRPNQVVVKINNEDNPDIPPGKTLKTLDFNYYGGIYRNVYLVITREIYMTNAVNSNKSGGGGILVRFDNVTQRRADGMIRIHVSNESGKQEEIHFKAVLTGKEGIPVNIISGKNKVESGAELELVQHFRVENPLLWSPQHPHLYDLTVDLFSGNEFTDRITEKVGIRDIRLNEEGFLLNGEKMYIRGTNRHQEYPYIGYALSDEAHYRDAVKIKNAGFDFVRLSHYPHSEAFMDACDEVGLMVMNCIPGWQFFGDEQFIENSLQDCKDLVRRDRNHPSVIFWELSLNETQMTDDFIMKANQILRTELPFEGTYSAGWVDHPAYDLFIPARQHGQPPDYWNYYKEGKRNVFIAEYGDWEYYAQNAGFNQTAYQNLREEERTSRQLRESGEKRLLQQALNFREAASSNRKGIGTIGDANWLMVDYNRGYADDIEASGISDIFRLPKFAFWFYQSQRPPEEHLQQGLVSGPVIKIASYWNVHSSTEVTVFSNCEEVKLLLNDSLIAKQKPSSEPYSANLTYPPFIFKIGKFVPGMLTATGYIKGKAAVNDQVTTAGAPASIRLEADFSGKPVSAERPDVIFLYAFVVDQYGNVVPEADDLVTFSLEGEATLIGDNPVPAKAGVAAILLRTEAFATPVKIIASANGLKEAELELSPVKAE